MFFDSLFKRYASPFLFIDGYISTKQFESFVFRFIETVNEEKEEESRWEFYLHKVFDKSYNDFKEDMRISRETMNMSADEQEATVLNSLNILGGFNPTKKG